jgi:hemolysin D
MSTIFAQTSAAPVATPPSHPLVEMWRHYASVFKAAWVTRDQLAGPKRLADEVAFLPAALSLQETPVHPAPRRAAIAICALFVTALVWACLGQIDIVAVAQGRIVVSQRTKTLQPLETSVVKAIHAKDGDKVQAGQLLVELDATNARADGKRVDQELSAAVGDFLRAQALLLSLERGGNPSLPKEAELSSPELLSARTQLAAEWADIEAKQAKLEAEIARRKAEIATAAQLLKKLDSTLPLARKRETDYMALSDQGYVAGHAGQDRTRERIEIERDQATAQARTNEAQAALSESEFARGAYRAETLRNLRDRLALSELKRGQLREEAVKAKQRSALTELRAAVGGTVQQLAIHTTGGVVTPAQVLLVVVPDDAAVTAEVTIDNKDVGFIGPGQEVEIKFETFPFTRYGTVHATVATISADAVNDEKRGAIFPATLVLQQTSISVDGKTIKLAPGMNLTAEIKTGRRRVIEYLMNPVQKHLHESLKER